MTFDVRGLNLPLSEALKKYTERRLGFALRRFDRRIGGVRARIFDVNGPRGGADKCCRIRADIVPNGMVLVECTDPDAYAAIDRAANRLEQSVGRSLRRIRDVRRGRESIRQAGVFAQR
jgi:putative sigma-54 modulation protein